MLKPVDCEVQLLNFVHNSLQSNGFVKFYRASIWQYSTANCRLQSVTLNNLIQQCSLKTETGKINSLKLPRSDDDQLGPGSMADGRWREINERSRQPARGHRSLATLDITPVRNKISQLLILQNFNTNYILNYLQNDLSVTEPNNFLTYDPIQNIASDQD